MGWKQLSGWGIAASSYSSSWRSISQYYAIITLLILQICIITSEGGDAWLKPYLKTSYSCQGDVLNLTCPHNLVIKVMRANYGRFSLTICNPEGVNDWSVNCMAPRSLRIVQDRCNGEQNCSIEVKSEIFGEPCSTTPKYLEVYFGCFQETTTTTPPTPNPLPPWMTTKSNIPFRILPGFLDSLDLDITTPAPQTTTEKSTTFTTENAPTTTTTNALKIAEEQQHDDIQENVGSGANKEDNNVIAAMIDNANPNDEVLKTTENIAQANVDESSESKLVYTLQTANNSQGVKVILSTLPLNNQEQEGEKGGVESTDPLTTLDYNKQEMNNPTHNPAPLDDIKESTTTSPFYSSYNREETYPPVHYGKSTFSPILSPHCTSVVIRSLSWPPTHPGSVAQIPCPAGTRGLAHWACGSTQEDQPSWLTQQPDLSECQSYWIDKIILELRKSDSIVTIAQDMVDYVRVNTLYGGDIIAIIKAMTIITEKLDFQIRNIPTLDQREAMAMEVAQSMSKVASNLLEVKNLSAWKDLPSRLRMKLISSFISTLQQFLLILPRTIANDREVSLSSPNLLMVLKKMSFRNIRSTEFPSPASKSTRDWANYADKVQIPALVLMENMAVDGSHAAFLTSRNLNQLMSSSSTDRVTNTRRIVKIVNSQVIHVSLSQTESYSTVEEPITVIFKHLSTFTNLTLPECVSWDTGISAWSGVRCAKAFSNQSHTVCECNTVGTMALLETLDTETETDSRHEVTMVFIIIVSITVTIIVAISAVLLSVYCSRVKVESELKLCISRAGFPCFKSSKASPQNSYSYASNLSNLYSSTGSPTFTSLTSPHHTFSTLASHNIFPNRDFMMMTQEQQRQQQQQMYSAAELGLDANKLSEQQAAAYHQHQLSGGHQMTSRSMPGPQVPVSHTMDVHNGSQRSQQAIRVPLHDVSSIFHQQRLTGGLPAEQLTSSTPIAFQHMEEVPLSNWGEGVSSHIYMEVDPLYNIAGIPGRANQYHGHNQAQHIISNTNSHQFKKLPNSQTQVEFITSPCSEEEELDCSTPGLGSSNCSQSSSGYSTAPPSEYYGKSAARQSDRKSRNVQNTANTTIDTNNGYSNISDPQQINVKNLTKEHVFNLNQYHQFTDSA